MNQPNNVVGKEIVINAGALLLVILLAILFNGPLSIQTAVNWILIVLVYLTFRMASAQRF